MPALELGSSILIARAANRPGDALASLSGFSPANASCRMVHTGPPQCSRLVRLLLRDLFSFSEFRLLRALGVLR